MNKTKEPVQTVQTKQEETEAKYKHVAISKSRNTITVVAVVKDDRTVFGVARCGTDQRYDKDLGIGIAANRAIKQPYTSVQGIASVGTCQLVAEVIVNHINNEYQPAIQNLKRIKGTIIKA